ncbi:hypothetical protein HPG69_008161, partial [Diceros bicornis minor]
YLLVTPRVLRVGSPENIHVQAHPDSRKPLTRPLEVNLTVWDFPMKKTVVARSQLVLSRENGFMVRAPVTIPESLVYPPKPGQRLGTWSIEASHHSAAEQKFKAAFDVKEYVLPSFEVQLEPNKTFFSLKDEALGVDIQARYVFNKPVDGHALVIFGIKQDSRRIPIQSSLQRVEISEGQGHVSLQRNTLMAAFQGPEKDFNETSIFVNVTVFSSGGEMVQAEISGVKIVQSPYNIKFTRTPQYFKPGMPFHFRVETDEYLQSGEKASATMTAWPYSTQDGSGNFLHIEVKTLGTEVGRSIQLSLNTKHQDPATKDQISHFTILVLSKGQIVYAKQQLKSRGSVYTSAIIDVTSKMLPSFRILAFYLLPRGAGQDPELLKVGLKNDEPPGTLEPNSQVELKVTGDAEATVGLVAVDKAVYVLNSRHKLTQKKVWDMVEEHDIGCTAGSGKDRLAVFKDAGLDMKMSTGMDTLASSEWHCPQSPPPSRHRRSLKRLETKRNAADEDEDFDDIFEDDLPIRTLFPESWLWRKVTLPKSESGSISHYSTIVNVPDSITTWQLVAVSLKAGQGLCVSDPFELIVRKEFFVDLKLPSSVIRNEQVQIQAVLYNFKARQVKVRVEFPHKEPLCSASKPGTPLRQEGGRIEQLSHSIFLNPQGQTQTELVPKRDFLNKMPNTEAEVFVSVQGYTRMLTHRSADGTYHTSKGSPGSTWLTSYVFRVFALTYSSMTISVVDLPSLCAIPKWIITQRQAEDGHFLEEGPVVMASMQGGYQHSEADVSLTALVLIALNEGKEFCSRDVPNLIASMKKASNFLEKRLLNIQTTFAIAVVSYALALTNSPQANHHLDSFASHGGCGFTSQPTGC